MHDEPFSNPIAPPTAASSSSSHAGQSASGPHFTKPSDIERHNLSNEDFRKLLSTPRSSSGSSAGPAAASRILGSVRGSRKTIVIDQQFKVPPATPSRAGGASDADKKKGKKKFHTANKSEEEERL